MNQTTEWSVTTYAAYVKAALGVLTGQPQSLVIDPKFTYCWPHGSASDNYNVVLGFTCKDENSCQKFAENINKLREKIGGYGIIAYTNKKSLTVCIDPYNHLDVMNTVGKILEEHCDTNQPLTLNDQKARFFWDLFHRGS
jgi:hypothetical protein